MSWSCVVCCCGVVASRSLLVNARGLACCPAVFECDVSAVSPPAVLDGTTLLGCVIVRLATPVPCVLGEGSSFGHVAYIVPCGIGRCAASRTAGTHAASVSRSDSSVSSRMVACAVCAVDGVVLCRFGGGVHSCRSRGPGCCCAHCSGAAPVAPRSSLSVSVMYPSVSSSSAGLSALPTALGGPCGVAAPLPAAVSSPAPFSRAGWV